MLSYESILQKWREKEFHTVEDIDVALNNFRILFAYITEGKNNRGFHKKTC